MKITVREFIELWADGTHDDIDVYDNVCVRNWELHMSAV